MEKQLYTHAPFKQRPAGILFNHFSQLVFLKIVRFITFPDFLILYINQSINQSISFFRNPFTRLLPHGYGNSQKYNTGSSNMIKKMNNTIYKNKIQVVVFVYNEYNLISVIKNCLI